MSPQIPYLKAITTGMPAYAAHIFYALSRLSHHQEYTSVSTRID